MLESGSVCVVGVVGCTVTKQPTRTVAQMNSQRTMIGVCCKIIFHVLNSDQSYSQSKTFQVWSAKVIVPLSEW